jgi:hypothetical protein
MTTLILIGNRRCADVFLPPQENLWVNFGSGRAPSA